MVGNRAWYWVLSLSTICRDCIDAISSSLSWSVWLQAPWIPPRLYWFAILTARSSSSSWRSRYCCCSLALSVIWVRWAVGSGSWRSGVRSVRMVEPVCWRTTPPKLAALRAWRWRDYRCCDSDRKTFWILSSIWILYLKMVKYNKWWLTFNKLHRYSIYCQFLDLLNT